MFILSRSLIMFFYSIVLGAAYSLFAGTLFSYFFSVAKYWTLSDAFGVAALGLIFAIPFSIIWGILFAIPVVLRTRDISLRYLFFKLFVCVCFVPSILNNFILFVMGVEGPDAFETFVVLSVFVPVLGVVAALTDFSLICNRFSKKQSVS